MSTFRRLAKGGRIDRTKSVGFTYNGKALTGFAGDTLASALLANGTTLMARSFKYHRPRGVVSAGVEEPNALMTIGGNEPNIPATTVELVEGLQAATQNAWPSVNYDVMAVNSLAAPLFQSGFYYKTFMGPFRKSWMFYEPFIRRAAGLGKIRDEPDASRYDTLHDFCDVLVVGSGPHGLSAAVKAARTGARVTLVEQDSKLGGSLLSEQNREWESWRNNQVNELLTFSDVKIRTRTTAQGLYDDNLVVLQQRHIDHDASKGKPRQTLVLLRAKSIVFATGSLERPLVFSNNDRPGVMLASALRTYLNRYGLAPLQRTVIATNNDSAYFTAFDLAEAGVAVTIADLRREIPSDLLSRAAMLGLGIFPASGVADVEGAKQVKRVQLGGAHSASIDCDVLAMSGGWSPTVHLTSHGGVKPVYDARIAAFVPGAFAASHSAVGAVMGDFDWPAEMGMPKRPYKILPSWVPVAKGRGKAFVDFQSDVTVKDITSAHDEGYVSVEHLKRYATLGMGTDQGKTSNINALAIMANLRELPIEEAGTTTFRPPYTGLAIGAIAGRTIGHHFRPTRLSPLHEVNKAHGATFIEAGLWLRAWYYAWAGNTPETAYVKEMELVRQGVGIADVSTLGKIDVQGPDAAEFLNRVYVNGFAKLPVGRARYGVMLNDDGVVLDDGTTTRISDEQFYLTTTTAQAGEVMSWLEYLLQVHWTELKVHVTSLTDEWGAMAISGPKSRQALQLAFPGADISNENLPYMGCLDVLANGLRVRLLRLSFSGELAYEVHVPADFAGALWEHFLKVAEPLGIKPYGLEALASLRIEKGHVAGLELDHRNTLDDLGLGRMAGKEKAYIGRELRMREAYQAPDRWSLVGIELMEEGAKLRGGAILFSTGDEIKGHGRGYITSVTWSTELKKFIALGLYQGGLKHEGEDIICAYPLKGENVKARIVSPHFIDREGSRLNA